MSDENPLTMLRKHLQVIQVLSKRYIRGLAKQYPTIATIYLRRYLATGFDKKTRREIVQFHYGYLEAHVIESFSDVIRQEPLLWWHEGDLCTSSIRLSFNADDQFEGDLSLVFFMGESYLFELSFTIVPGQVVGSCADAVMLIARLQGAKGRADDIRAVTKDCGDISPQLLLVTAAYRIADLLRLKSVCGISNDQQLWRDDKEVQFNYDVFWEKFGAQRTTRDFFEIAIPYAQKPLDQISASHRRRTRIKRLFKDRAAEVAGENFEAKYLRAERPSPAARAASSRAALA